MKGELPFFVEQVIELRYDFINLGYDLVWDLDTVRSKSVLGDVLADSLISRFKDGQR